MDDSLKMKALLGFRLVLLSAGAWWAWTELQGFKEQAEAVTTPTPSTNHTIPLATTTTTTGTSADASTTLFLLAEKAGTCGAGELLVTVGAKGLESASWRGNSAAIPCLSGLFTGTSWPALSQPVELSLLVQAGL
jgi:hypothetical protein